MCRSVSGESSDCGDVADPIKVTWGSHTCFSVGRTVRSRTVNPGLMWGQIGHCTMTTLITTIICARICIHYRLRPKSRSSQKWSRVEGHHTCNWINAPVKNPNGYSSSPCTENKEEYKLREKERKKERRVLNSLNLTAVITCLFQLNMQAILFIFSTLCFVLLNSYINTSWIKGYFLYYWRNGTYASFCTKCFLNLEWIYL